MLACILKRVTSSARHKGGLVYKLQEVASSQPPLTTSCNRALSARCLPSITPTRFIPSSTELSSHLIKKISIIDKPLTFINAVEEISDKPIITYKYKINWNEAVEEPVKIIEKHAERLIVIRRKKMRVHKLKKLRKKMKFEWERARHKRKVKREKAFHAELMGQIKEAENFDPVVYASTKISKANEVFLPTRWRGKRLPEFVIKDLLEKKRIKKEKKLAWQVRRKNMSFNVSDYNV